MNVIEGGFAGAEGRYAIVAARFNGFLVESLIQGARDTLVRHGIDDDAITLVRVPGAFEIAPVCERLADGEFDAIIALGAVIRGGTPHFDYVAGACAKGVEQVAMEAGIPVIFGVLTCDTIEQAVERSGTKAGNKGADAAMAALEMVDLHRKLDEL